MPRKRPAVVDLKQTASHTQQSRPQPTPHTAPIPTHSWVDFIETDLDFDLDLDGLDTGTKASESPSQPVLSQPEYHHPRFLSTDPLELFLPVEEYHQLELQNRSLAANPIRFVPDTQRDFPVLYQQPEPAYPWWEGVEQWIDRISSGWSLADISLPEVRFPEIEFPEITLPRLSWDASLKPALAAFASLVILSNLVLPTLSLANRGVRVKDNVSLQVAAAERLVRADGEEGLFVVAQHLEDVSAGLAHASEDISGLQGNLSLITRYIPGLSLGYRIERLTRNSAEFSLLSAELLQAIEPFSANQVNPFDAESEKSLTQSVKDIQEVTRRMYPVIDAIERDIQAIPARLVPGSVRTDLEFVQNVLPVTLSLMDELDQAMDLFLTFVGYDFGRRYLFVFQNNQELRATGGFIGSYGLMNIDQGVVESLDIEEIYRPDGQLTRFIQPPKPLQELTPRWFLRDSNWFADFPTSADRMMAFYEKTGGPTPDGVISLTPTVIERLLRITGPIEMDGYDTIVNADNFVRVTQYQTSEAYDLEENRPKQFIDDLAPELISRLLSAGQEQFPQVLESLLSSLQERHLMVYFLDNDIQQRVEDLNIGGHLYQTEKDYLQINHSNIGGFKTDGVIEDDITINTQIAQDGRVTNTVTVKRQHKGGETEFEWWNKPHINYMRLYVPKGATLIGSTGFEPRKQPFEWEENISSYDRDPVLRAVEQTEQVHSEWNIIQSVESGKTVFAGWKSTAPQDTSEISITYELPFTVTQDSLYTSLHQKQAGVIGGRFRHSVNVPPQWRIDWTESSQDLDQPTPYSVQYEGVMRQDQYLGLRLR